MALGLQLEASGPEWTGASMMMRLGVSRGKNP